jgi:hypothetical protein
MARGNTVELVFAGDSKSLERTFDRVGGGAKDMARDLSTAEGKTKSFGGAMDTAAEAVGGAEGKFMGTADLLDGLGGAFGLPTDGATNLARSFGDLSGGFSTLGPLMSGLASGPIGAIALAVGGLTAGVIALYQNSETFRDIVSGAFKAVESVVGPIINGIGNAISGVLGWFKSGSGESDAFAEQQKLDAEEAAAAWEDWNTRVTAQLDDITNPLERARDKTQLSLGQIQTNLTDNVAFYTGWINNLKVLTDRGFGDLATIMYKLGPDTEKAVGEAIKLSDPKLTELQNQFKNKFSEAGSQAANVLVDGIGGKDYKELGTTIGESITQGVGQAITKAGDNIKAIKAPDLVGGFQSGIGGFLGGVPDAIGGFFGDIGKSLSVITGRAGGGPVSAGTPYVVGERGPELFVPGMSGAIIPNRAAAAPNPDVVIQLVLDGRVVTEVVHQGLLRKQRNTPLGLAS